MDQAGKLQEKEVQLNNYKDTIQNLKENLESKVSCIAELNEKLKAQEEMYSENLNAALHSNVVVDDHGRGNSLFSEVESRRVKGMWSNAFMVFVRFFLLPKLKFG